ncbi:MAG: GntR family transcriptional regulator [Planctomycetota bacterium]
MSNRTVTQSPAKHANGKRRGIFAPLVAEGGKPLYVSAKNVIRRAIDEGRFTADEKMPSTQQLADELDVSLVTAHRAMQELVSGGVLRRMQGRGTFVNPVAGTGSGVRARGRLGVVLHRDSSLADFYHGRIVEGVRQASHDLHADLLLLRFGEDLRQECDGLLFINPLRDEVAKVGEHARAGMPCVVVGAQLHGDGENDSDSDGEPLASLCCIDTDNRAIARQAATHLQDLGHTRIETKRLVAAARCIE